MEREEKIISGSETNRILEEWNGFVPKRIGWFKNTMFVQIYGVERKDREGYDHINEK